MRGEDFAEGFPGALVQTRGGAYGYLPDPLPARLDLDDDVLLHSEQASISVGRLDQLGRSLPNPLLLIQPFIRREAVASSRMERTTANLDQLVVFDALGKQPTPDSDVREVASYVVAVNHALQRGDREVTTGLIREMHHLLLDGVRGGMARPGRFRDQQNRIGRRGQAIAEARFVPLPPDQVPGLTQDLERFWLTPQRIPIFVRLALIHYQFETIHPFLDGNGRLGRLLMSVLLDAWDVLSEPLLYLSSAIEAYRNDYRDGMLRVSQTGDWNTWIRFFLRAIEDSATDALDRGNRLADLREHWRSTFSDRGATTMRLIDELSITPAFPASAMSARLEVTCESTRKTVERLITDGLLIEVTGRPRNRVYVARDIIAIVDPIPAGQTMSEAD